VNQREAAARKESGWSKSAKKVRVAVQRRCRRPRNRSQFLPTSASVRFTTRQIRQESELQLAVTNETQSYRSSWTEIESLFRQRRKIMLVLLRRKSADCSPRIKPDHLRPADAIGDHPSVDGSMNTRIAMFVPSSAPWRPSGLRARTGQTTQLPGL